MSETPSAVARRAVLVVDDLKDIRTLATLALKGAGFEVLTAASSPEALEVVARHAGPIDLLLADVGLPGMPGGELSRRLAQARPGMRRLLCSGHSRDELVQSGQIEAGVPFLPKPFLIRDLVAKVREVLSAESRGPALPPARPREVTVGP
jgi:CheY-like chemotaxis protein